MWAKQRFMTLFLSACLPSVPAAAGDLTPLHAAIAADEPALWYQFNETTGDPAVINHGSLGAAYNGAFPNGLTLEIPTLDGDTGARFDATLGQFVESMADAPADFTGNPSFTVEVVVEVDLDSPVLGGYPPFLHWGPPANGQSVFFGLWSNADNRIYSGFFNGGVREVSTYPRGCLVHFAWTRDSDGGTNGPWTGSTLYVNGAPVPVTTDLANVAINVGSTPFRVQRGAPGFSRFFSGVMDEVALYDRLLTPQEIAEHADLVNGTPPARANDFHDAVASSEPALWYQLNEAGCSTRINHGSLGPEYDAFQLGLPAGSTDDTPVGDGGIVYAQNLQHYLESIANAPEPFLGNPTFTCETIVRINSETAPPINWAPFLHWGSPASGGGVYFSLQGNVNDRLYAGFDDRGLRAQSRITPDQFYHVVWVRDSFDGAATPQEGSTLYINGQHVGLEDDTDLVGGTAINVTATPFRTQRATDFVRYFSGTMDELALYDRALTPAEVAAHFATLALPGYGCTGDLSADNTIGPADLAVLLSAWTGSTPYDPCPPLIGPDFNGDCRVDSADLATLLANWGECTP